MVFDTNPKARKDMPICSGVFDYFPLALAEVAKASKAGNDQHNPGQPLFWNRGKSTDHADCLLRHLVERGTTDTDGVPHSAKVAWRALAILQLEMEKENELSSQQQDEYYPDCLGTFTDLFYDDHPPRSNAGLRPSGPASSDPRTNHPGATSQDRVTLAEVMQQWQQRQDLEEEMREEWIPYLPTYTSIPDRVSAVKLRNGVVITETFKYVDWGHSYSTPEYDVVAYKE